MMIIIIKMNYIPPNEIKDTELPLFIFRELLWNICRCDYQIVKQIKELFEIMQMLSYCCYNCSLHFHSNLN